MAKNIVFSRCREYGRLFSLTLILVWTSFVGCWLFCGSSQTFEKLRTSNLELESDDSSDTVFSAKEWQIENISFFKRGQPTPKIAMNHGKESGSSIIYIDERATTNRLSRPYGGLSVSLPLQSAISITNLSRGNLNYNGQRSKEDAAAASSSSNYTQFSKILASKFVQELRKFENEKGVSVELDGQRKSDMDNVKAAHFRDLNKLESSTPSKELFQAGRSIQINGESDKSLHRENSFKLTNIQDQGEGSEMGTFRLGSNSSSSGRNTRHCRTVEEMGAAAASDSTHASLRVRERIQAYLAEHGAQNVRSLRGKQFCKRNFVLGRAYEDGFGNEIYKILNAAGLGIMLNRSLIIGEHSSTNPAYLGLSGNMEVSFGDYIMYSNQTFSMREVKHLWVMHGCADIYKRPLTIRIDSIARPSTSSAFCEDWTKWQHPIIWFQGAEDAVALQLFLKNINPAMSLAATLLLGDPSQPSSRPNLFGELMRAFIEPLPLLKEAVDWALQAGPPDIALHLRMLNSRSHRATDAASNCIKKIIAGLPNLGRKCRVALVSDTPSVINDVKEKLTNTAKVIHFDYQRYIHSCINSSIVMSEHYFQPPRKRMRDWGSLPRWVALVEFFLASRAKYAVVSGAYKRVGTTFAQLVGSLASAYSLDENNQNMSSFHFYSSFQAPILGQGLTGQRGRSHVWRTFGGSLSCTNQQDQCALTPLLPYAWWDGPMQSPIQRDIQKLRALGIRLNETGNVALKVLESHCLSRRKPSMQLLKLKLPTCKQLKICH